MTRKIRNVILFLLVVILTGCSKPLFNSKWTSEKAPADFVARFETSKGSFDVEIKGGVSVLHGMGKKAGAMLYLSILRTIQDLIR